MSKLVWTNWEQQQKQLHCTKQPHESKFHLSYHERQIFSIIQSTLGKASSVSRYCIHRVQIECHNSLFLRRTEAQRSFLMNICFIVFYSLFCATFWQVDDLFVSFEKKQKFIAFVHVKYSVNTGSVCSVFEVDPHHIYYKH